VRIRRRSLYLPSTYEFKAFASVCVRRSVPESGSMRGHIRGHRVGIWGHLRAFATPRAQAHRGATSPGDCRCFARARTRPNACQLDCPRTAKLTPTPPKSRVQKKG
jgi:hypothetical protein